MDFVGAALFLCGLRLNIYRGMSEIFKSYGMLKKGESIKKDGEEGSDPFGHNNIANYKYEYCKL